MVYKTIQLYIQQLYEQLRLYVRSRPKHVQNTFIPVLTENWSFYYFLKCHTTYFYINFSTFHCFWFPFYAAEL